MHYLIQIALCLTFTACTISVTSVNNHGNGISDTVDEDQKADAQVSPDISVPLACEQCESWEEYEEFHGHRHPDDWFSRLADSEIYHHPDDNFSYLADYGHGGRDVGLHLVTLL